MAVIKTTEYTLEDYGTSYLTFKPRSTGEVEVNVYHTGKWAFGLILSKADAERIGSVMLGPRPFSDPDYGLTNE